ncbi:MAG: hypothetical protein R3C05_07685 [Pirellulaceae bacterium]
MATTSQQPTTFSGLDGSGISGEAADLNNDGLLDLFLAVDMMHNHALDTQ